MSAPECPPALRARLQRHIDAGRTPGLQYVAVDASGVIADCALGWADIGQRRPMTADTTLMAYSMTKTVTAVAILQLVARGAIDLDAPVVRYLPDAPYGDAPTVRALLAHTSGVPNPIPLRWVHPVSVQPRFDDRAALQAVWGAHPKLAHAPGSRYVYSNIGYWMLGATIEEVTHSGFADYVTQHVLTPLGLSPDVAGFAIARPDHHATGYLERWSLANLLSPRLFDAGLLGEYDGRWRRVRDHYPNGPAFGGLVATAGAFARLLHDQLQPHSLLLDDDARALLYEQQATTKGTLVPMTLGWHVRTDHGQRVFYKEGGGGGFHCLMRLYPHRALGTVVMANATAFDVNRCLDEVDRIMATSLADSHSPSQ